MNPAARKSGISQVAELGWGAHFCHFYETKSDLLDILIPYFSQGLAHNELCVWITFAPLAENDAREELIRALPDGELHLRRGDIEIAPFSDWYLSTGEFNLSAVIDKWKQKLAYARERGYEGLRVNGNEAWLTRRNWQDFAGYEEQLNQMIAGQPIIVLCTYPLSTTTADQLFDVARSHQFVIARRHGMWEVLETAASREAKEDLLRMTRELEKRVVERTSALESANEQLRALSARLQTAREEEGARIGRELHDEVGSSLASLKWDLERLAQVVGGDGAHREIERMTMLVDTTIAAIRRIASELRPSILESLGFAEAVECLATGFRQRTGVACHVSIPGEIQLGHDEATSLFRIAQEALTNVMRHANARVVDIRLEQNPRETILTIRDDGQGIPAGGEHAARALGIAGMRERARLVEGQFEIKGIEGEGTAITVRIPFRVQSSPTVRKANSDSLG